MPLDELWPELEARGLSRATVWERIKLLLAEAFGRLEGPICAESDMGETHAQVRPRLTSHIRPSESPSCFA